jgi:hypothetical protein
MNYLLNMCEIHESNPIVEGSENLILFLSCEFKPVRFLLALMPAPVGVLNHSLDQEYRLLRLLAETFEFELEQERQVQSNVGASLPQEWVDYLERERQEILDKIHQNEHGIDEESVSLSDKNTTPIVHPPILRTLPPTSASHTDIHDGQNFLPSSRSICEPASGSNIATNNVHSPSQQKEMIHCPAHEGMLALTLLLRVPKNIYS